MLVLSRKQNQKILFPGLGIELEVCRVSGKSVSVGIKAPKSVSILRGELAADDDPRSDSANEKTVAGRKELQHSLRNQLNKAQLTVAIAQKQLQKGENQDAEQTLREMLCRLTEIDQQIGRSETSHASPQVPTVTGRDNSRRALVVEDDANERALMAGYLQLCGFEISEASDGVEALDILGQQDVDLVVLDMQMPRMDGRETAREIRRRSSLRNTRVVVVSGEDREESTATGDDRDFTEWFSKPLDANRFASYLDATMN